VDKQTIFFVFCGNLCNGITAMCNLGNVAAKVITMQLIISSRYVATVRRDCNPGSLFSIQGSGIEESVIPRSRRD